MAVHLITIYGACVMFIHQLMLENASDIFWYLEEPNTHWYWVLIMAGTWDKQKLGKVGKIPAHCSFESVQSIWIHLSQQKQIHIWLDCPGCVCSTIWEHVSSGDNTPESKLNFLFVCPQLGARSRPPVQHQPSHPTWTMSELFPAACRCEGGIKYLPLFAASGSNYVEFELCCAELSRWQLGTSPQKVPEDFTEGKGPLLVESAH